MFSVLSLVLCTVSGWSSAPPLSKSPELGLVVTSSQETRKGSGKEGSALKVQLGL